MLAVYIPQLSLTPDLESIEIYSTLTDKVDIPKGLLDLAIVFFEEEAIRYPAKATVRHLIEVKEGKKVLFRSIYPLAANEL
jgi:hypothetical protein